MAKQIQTIFAFIVTPVNVSVLMYYFFSCVRMKLKSESTSHYVWTVFRLAMSVSIINFFMVQIQFGLFKYGDHEGQLAFCLTVPVCFFFCSTLFFAINPLNEKRFSYWSHLKISLIVYLVLLAMVCLIFK